MKMLASISLYKIFVYGLVGVLLTLHTIDGDTHNASSEINSITPVKTGKVPVNRRGAQIRPEVCKYKSVVGLEYAASAKRGTNLAL